MTDLIPEDFRQRISEERESPRIDVDVLAVPDAKYLPSAVKKALKERDEAHAAFVDLEDQYIDILTPGWRELALKKDRAAAREAVAAGKDPFSLPSALEQAERDRPRALAVVEAAAAKVRVADRKLRDAVRQNLPAITKAVGQDLAKARDAYLSAQAAADAAREVFGGLLALRDRAVDWELGQRTDWPSGPASPRLANGGEAAEYGRPVRPGLREVKLIEESFRRVGVTDLYVETGEPTQVSDPLVRVRVKNSGLVMEIKASHARAHVAAGLAEYVDEDEVSA